VGVVSASGTFRKHPSRVRYQARARWGMDEARDASTGSLGCESRDLKKSPVRVVGAFRVVPHRQRGNAPRVSARKKA